MNYDIVSTQSVSSEDAAATAAVVRPGGSGIPHPTSDIAHRADIAHPPSRFPHVPAVPDAPIRVRAATGADLPFIDALQKKHSRMVGWFPTSQLEAYLAGGHVLVAERGEQSYESQVPSFELNRGGPATYGTLNSEPETRNRSSVGYCIAKDRYAGRDDVGIIYQLNVAPGSQRSLVGATLIKEVFARSAYGCRLFGLWCAQDLQANFFWQSLGFVPLAFRAGSRGRKRIHIYWQRRVRANDDGMPYWFPSQTRNGAVREDRIVLPIPPGTGWRDAKLAVYPEFRAQSSGLRVLPDTPDRFSSMRNPQLGTRNSRAAASSRHLQGVPTGKAAIITGGKLRYVALPRPAGSEKKPARPKRVRAKADPRHVAAARELRDRYLEHINSPAPAPAPGGGRALLEELASGGRYDVSRALPEAGAAVRASAPLLPAEWAGA